MCVTHLALSPLSVSPPVCVLPLIPSHFSVISNSSLFTLRLLSCLYMFSFPPVFFSVFQYKLSFFFLGGCNPSPYLCLTVSHHTLSKYHAICLDWTPLLKNYSNILLPFHIERPPIPAPTPLSPPLSLYLARRTSFPPWVMQTPV